MKQHITTHENSRLGLFPGLRIGASLVIFGLLNTLIPISVPASTLPTLPVSPRIRTGVLDAGVTYYVVTNPTQKNKVDIALVQKVGKDNESEELKGSTVVQARSSLTDIPHFKNGSPLSFMTDNGIWPDSDGYVTIGRRSTVFQFRDIDVLLKPAAVDSTLLMLFDIIEKEPQFMSGRYAPVNQALIVSGDIDPALVLGKIYMLSMMVNRRKGEPAVAADQSTKIRGPKLVIQPKPSPGTSAVTVDYAIPRTPASDMNTVQPLVVRRFISEASVILRKRLKKALRDEGIPVADVSFSYTPSSATPGPEHFSVRVVTSPDRLQDATKVIAGILAEFDMAGAHKQEYMDATADVLTSMKASYQGDNLPNKAYIDMCTGNFLYGASLASPKTDLDFFTKRNVDNDLSLKLFNDFAQAAVDRSTSLTITAEADSSKAAGLLRIFDTQWTGTTFLGNAVYTPADRDTAALAKKQIPKVKVSIDNPEPLSGGRMWTFSNGIKVIFKKAPTGSEGMFHFSWLFKSGYSWVPDLGMGEGAYISDMLWQSDFAGLSSNTFRDILTAGGVKMDAKVSLSDFQIEGHAPVGKVDLVMKSLIAMANERTVSKKAYDTYRVNETLRGDIAVGGPQYRLAVLDSLMHPTSNFSRYKKPLELKDDFKDRCETLFQRVFSRTNDGVLIIVGDFNEDALKKTLCKYMGGFKTDKVATFRTRLSQFVSPGHNIKYSVAEEPSLDIQYSVPLTNTVDNFLSAQIAAYLLEDKIGSEAALCGWSINSDWYMEMFPEERFYFYTQLTPSKTSGLPASIVQEDNVESVIERIDKAVTDISSRGIDAKTLASAKKMLGNIAADWNTTPENIIAFLLIRYSYGKDLMTDQAAKVNSVSLNTVNTLLKSIGAGPSAKFAVRKRHTGEILATSLPITETFEKAPAMHKADSDSTGISGLYWEMFQGVEGADLEKDKWWNIREISKAAPVRKMPISLPMPSEIKPDDGKVIEEDSGQEVQEALVEEETETETEENSAGKKKEQTVGNEEQE